jgi:hypothetical protein
MSATPLDIPFRRPAIERRLYTGAAIVALVAMFAGFAPSYYLKGVYGAPELTTLKHLHGIVMTSWFVLFFVQVRLVAAGNVRMHRKLGKLGALLALLVIYVGTTLGIESARSGASPAGIPPLVFLVLPLGEMVTFAILVAAAIALRKKAAYHKRLMLVATVAMLTPAIARLPVDFISTNGPPAFFGITDLIIIACIAFDTVKNRRLHPAFAAGLALVIVVQVGRLVLSQTPQWTAFAKWLVA